jgi:hypothetical protein
MSEQQKDAVSRWLPTIVAIAAIVGNIVWLGARAGALEQRITYTESALVQTVTRAEYQADKSATANQLGDMKTTLREINTKIDRLVEMRNAPAQR